MEENSQPIKKSRNGLDDRKAALITTIEVIKSKKNYIFVVLALTVFGTLLGHNLKVSTYQTSATLFIQNQNKPSAAEYLLNQHAYRMARVDRIETYTNHLKSDSFYLRVAEKIKFHKEFEELNLDIPEKKSMLGLQYWKRRLLDDDSSEMQHKKLLVPVEKIVGFLKKTVTYHSDYTSQFIRVHSRTLDARTSQLVANLIADEFATITNLHSIEELQEVEDFVVNKKKATEMRVRELDKALISFKQKNNIVSTDQSTRILAKKLSDLESQIESAKLRNQENEKMIKYFESGRSKALKQIVSNGTNNNGLGGDETANILQKKLDLLHRQKSAFIAQGYSNDDFRISEINSEIDSLASRLNFIISAGPDQSMFVDPSKSSDKIRALQEENEVLKSKLGTLKKARVEMQAKVDAMPALQQEYIKLENQFTLEVENLAQLERKEKELEIQRISQKKEVRVDQRAILPGATPRGSLFFKLLFSMIISVFFAVAIILGIESLDPTVKRRQDLYDCGVEFIGEIPYQLDKLDNVRKKVMDFGSTEDLVCANQPDSIESMAFKYLRARIESMRYKNKKDCQIISVTSAIHNEGKSFICANLAISLSQLKRKTILVDADLRRPSQVSYFGLSAQDGLVDLINMKKNLSDVVFSDVYPNLDILPSGYSGNESTELISGQKFRIFLEFLRNEYEYVVIDTPPTFAAVDSAIISGYADIPILTSCFRETRKADLNEAYNDLLQVSYRKVYGIINKAIVSNARIHYYGYPLAKDNQTNPVAMMPKLTDDEAKEFMDRLNRKSS